MHYVKIYGENQQQINQLEKEKEKLTNQLTQADNDMVVK